MSNNLLVIFSGFGHRLRAWRENLNLSQSKVAELIGVSGPTIHEAEKGSNVGVKLIIGIASKWPNDIYYLLTGKHPETIQATTEERNLLETYRNADDNTKTIVDLALKIRKSSLPKGKLK
ncbi:MAG: transcriptional regulator [Nitrospinota bacterium]|nr:transcriptional regulator [Nitrospinota bacterium]